nr:YciI family protein [uncultured Albidiferax sp.]
MLYMIYSADDLDQVVEEDMIDQHRRYIESFRHHIRVGGPLLEEASGRPKGRVILIDLESHADAERFLFNDPFFKTGRIKNFLIERMSIV